jgi:hypothetical protein
MTPDRISSTGLPVTKSEKLTNNTRSGNEYTRVFTGSLAALEAQRLIYGAMGATHLELESLGDGDYQLSATLPWDVLNGSNAEPPVNSHELDEEPETTSVYNSKILLDQLVATFGSYAGANGAMAYLMGAVKNFNDNTDQGPDAQEKAEDVMGTVYDGGQLTLMLNLFRGIAYHKVETCRQTKTVYNRRITAASFNAIQATFVGMGMIWTTAEVCAFENTPEQWWFQLPSSALWFKSSPKVLTVSNQKTELTYSYTSCYLAWTGTDKAYASAALLSF